MDSSESPNVRRAAAAFAGAWPAATWRPWLLGALLVVATILTYIPALRAGYIWDDDMYVYKNRLVSSEEGLAGMWRIWWDQTERRLMIETPQYYPLVFSTFWLEHQRWGLAPFGYHLVNVLLHATVALLVWRLAGRLKIPAPWFIAAVFALHPAHVESVAWVTERKNVLSGVFYMLAFLSFLRFSDGGRRTWYALSLLFFLCALLSKTVTASLAGAVVLATFWRNGQITRRDVLRFAPFFAIGAVMGMLTAHLERTHVGALGDEWSHGMWERVAILMPQTFTFYARQIAWPHPLLFFYERWELLPQNPASYLALAGWIAAIAVMLGMRRRWGWGPLLLVCFSAGTLFPALGLLNVFPHRFSWVADHFNYLGSLGFIALYVSTVVWISRRVGALRRLRPRTGWTVGGFALLAMAAWSFEQAQSYEHEVRLYEDTIRENPSAWLAIINLGGNYMEHRRMTEAEALFEAALQRPKIARYIHQSKGLWYQTKKQFAAAHEEFKHAADALPWDYRAHRAMAGTYVELGEIEKGLASMRRSLELQPLDPQSWRDLAWIFDRKGDADQTLAALNRALEIKPHDAEALYFIGELLMRRGAPRDAIAYYRRAVSSAPDHTGAANGLIRALYASGDAAEAVRIAELAVRRFPNEVGILNDLAWIRATSRDAALRDGAAAVRCAERAGLHSEPDASKLDTLAACYAAAGRFPEAIDTAGRALALARREANAELAARIQQRLDLYASGKPYVQ